MQIKMPDCCFIDVNKAIEKINALCVDGNENWIGTENQSFVDHDDVIEVLSDMPIADVIALTPDYHPGDVCIYGFGDANKSCSLVEIVKILDDERGAAEVKFLKVFADHSGNGWFEHLFKTGQTMNASFKYLKNITPRKD